MAEERDGEHAEEQIAAAREALLAATSADEQLSFDGF